MRRVEYIILANGLDIPPRTRGPLLLPLCIQGLIRHHSVNPLQRLLTPSTKIKVPLIVARVLQIQRKQAMCVFLVAVVHIMTTHVLLGATSER